MKQGWKIKKLGEVCTFCSGYTPKENELSECGTVPYFKVSDMNHCDNLKYLMYTSLFLENGCKVYPKHTIVFPKNGAAIATNKKRILAQDSVVDLNTGGVIANDAVIYYEYLYLYFLSLDFRLHTRRGAVPTLDIAGLKNKSIPIPPCEEQERIVEELDCLSGVIEKKKQQLKELDALAQSIFYTMFGDPITNEKGWQVKKLGEVCENKKKILRASKEYGAEDEVNYIDISSIDNISNVITSPTPYVFGEAPSRAQQVVQKGDVIVSMVRPNLKNIAVVNCGNDNLVASSGFCVLRAKSEKITIPFLFYIVKSDAFTMYLMESVSGANYPAVRECDITDYSSILPPLALQQEFADKIEAIEKQKELIKKSISETETLFNARMDYYFN